MSLYGYHRTSTTEQHLDRGLHELNEYCRNNNLKIEKIFTDKITGKTFHRPRYTVLKEDVLRSGDSLIITEIDRLGRNKKEILNELKYFKDNDIRVMFLEIPTTLQDLSSLNNDMSKLIMETINNMLIELYATMAQAEMSKKEKRQKEGIEAKKIRGEWDDYGRPRAIDFNHFISAYKRVEANEIRPFTLMRELGLTKPTFYRYKKMYDDLLVKERDK